MENFNIIPRRDIYIGSARPIILNEEDVYLFTSQMNNEDIRIAATNRKQEEKIHQLEEKIYQLEEKYEELYYAPGNPGFLIAQADFEKKSISQANQYAQNVDNVAFEGHENIDY